MQEAYRLRLEVEISPRVASVFEGSLAIGRGRQVVLKEECLNFKNTVTAVATFGSNLLVVGLPAAVTAFEVAKNAEIFYNEVADGVNCIAISSSLVLVGGNCSVVGFSPRNGGAEVLWTVAGDNVRALAAFGERILVGSDDYDIKLLDGEEPVVEVTEADRVTALAALSEDRFAFGLANGTLGVYHRHKRVWRVKSKHELVAVQVVEQAVVSGWANGAVTSRNAETGASLFRATYGSVAAILLGDLRGGDGPPQVIVCSRDGEVRGLVPGAAPPPEEEESARLEHHLRARKKALTAALRLAGGDDRSAIPADTRVTVDVQGLDFVFRVAKHAVILSLVVVDSETGESVAAAYPSNAGPELRVAFPREKKAATLKIQAHVAARASSDAVHVFDLDYELPKFCAFVVSEDAPKPTSFVDVALDVSLQRLREWVDRSFIAGELPGTYASGDEVLSIRAEERDDNRTTDVRIWGTLATVSEVVQDLATYLNLQHLETTKAEFPVEVACLEELLERVAARNAIRLKLTADMAGETRRLKTLVVKLEDARLLADMTLVRRHLAELFGVNAQLVAEYAKRATNHEALVTALQDVNKMIQRAANLRVGAAKARCVADCRKAIKANATHALAAIVCVGTSQYKSQ
ncbi:hypothetical protein CTAYLR_002287 [Chrysophaeum taylorii]|uniref:Bardet-Biedl syndrome 2 protein homolog n=1 Tax=Chrysophaeum taylorii TaxID=2483200 RepID=A0AAD7UN09_9STRA|nr:hypothetical protein CTAYLR_002287 [Chrysophaeum taylorii]